MAYDGNYINQLNIDNPAGTEAKNLGDNAIREIKRALVTSFPNLVADEAFTGTLGDLNTAVAGACPRGLVAPWAGDFTTYPDGPDGWTICDGRARKTGGGTAPDLRGKFIAAATVSATIIWPPVEEQTGGSLETEVRVLAGGALKSFTTAGTTLTAAQSGLPAHTHTVSTHDHNSGGAGIATGSGGGQTAVSLSTSSTGGSAASQSHSHTFTIAKGAEGETYSNLPPFYALVYIIKD